MFSVVIKNKAEPATCVHIIILNKYQLTKVGKKKKLEVWDKFLFIFIE